jgi:hypothetical protein
MIASTASAQLSDALSGRKRTPAGGVDRKYFLARRQRCAAHAPKCGEPCLIRAGGESAFPPRIGSLKNICGPAIAAVDDYIPG